MYIFKYVQYSSRLLSKAEPDLLDGKAPAPGLRGRGTTGWESNPGPDINSHQSPIF